MPLVVSAARVPVFSATKASHNNCYYHQQQQQQEQQQPRGGEDEFQDTSPLLGGTKLIVPIELESPNTVIDSATRLVVPLSKRRERDLSDATGITVMTIDDSLDDVCDPLLDERARDRRTSKYKLPLSFGMKAPLSCSTLITEDTSGALHREDIAVEGSDHEILQQNDPYLLHESEPLPFISNSADCIESHTADIDDAYCGRSSEGGDLSTGQDDFDGSYCSELAVFSGGSHEEGDLVDTNDNDDGVADEHIATDGRTSSPYRQRLPSILKRNDQEEIPIRNGRFSWKQLPKPAPQALVRCRSEPAVATRASRDAQRLSVQFDAVIIRNFEQTVGDNPSVSYGPPITLDWAYSQSDPISLDQFEKNRGPRRSARQMMLNYYNRRNILAWKFGVTEEELKQAERDANRIKRERSMTRALLPAQKLQEIVESASRKTKRLTGIGSSKIGPVKNVSR
jgi:hypothetical protein